MTLPEVATLRCAQTGKQVMFQAWGCRPGRVQLYPGLQKAADHELQGRDPGMLRPGRLAYQLELSGGARLRGRTHDVIVDPKWALLCDPRQDPPPLWASTSTYHKCIHFTMSLPALSFLPGWGIEERGRRKAPADEEGATDC